MLGQIGHQHVADGGGGLPLLLAGDDALVLQAGVAVVVDTEGEGHVVGEGLALESHILDALPGGLGQVDLIVQADEVVVEIARLLRVKGDGYIPFFPLVPARGGPLHVSLHLRAGHLDGVEHIGVLVDVEQVAVVEIALFQVAGVLEQRNSGHVGAGVLQLDGADEIDDSGVLDAAGGDALDLVHRLEVGGGMAQHVVLNEGDGLFLGALDGGQLTQALVGLDALHGYGLHSGGGDLLVGVEGQVVAHHLAGIVLGLTHRDGRAVDVSGVGVAQLEHVHLGALVQDGLGCIGAVGGVLGSQAGMGGHHDDVGLAADLLDTSGHGVGHRLKGQVSHALLGAVPAGDVGSGDTDNGHLHAAPLHDSVARAGEVAAVGVLDVGRQHRHVHLLQNGLESVHTEIKLMVAQGPGIIVHVVEGGGHRVAGGVLGVEVVGHDGALDGVARVHQNGVGVLRAHLVDVGGYPG